MGQPTENLNQALLAAMARYAERPCFWTKRAGQFEATTYRHFESLAFRLANFFQGQGVSQGQRVAIIAHNSIAWVTAYVAGLLAGGVVVPIRAFLPPRLIHLRLQDSGASLAVIQNRRLYHMIAAAGPELSALSRVLIIADEDDLAESAPGVVSLAGVLARPVSAEERELIRAKAESISPQSWVAIHYTGNETGQPKGAVFSHAQRLAALQTMAEWFPLDEDDLAFTSPLPMSYLPHLNAMFHYFLSGVANALAESSETSFEDLQRISPTVTLTTPNAFEFIYNKVVANLDQSPAANQEMFLWALAVSKEYRAAGVGASPALREAYRRADMTFFSEIRGMLGGRLRRLYSVSAPLSPQSIDFAEAIGLLPLNLYGLTEAGGFPAISRPDATRPGSCGQVAPGFQLRIADDQEVWVRGPTVTRCYWQPDAQPRPEPDADGWLRTGDLGYFDQDGYLYLIGHKHAPTVLSTGRKIMPAAMEWALTASPFIAQAAVFGAGRRYVTALIMPDLAAIARHIQADEPGGAAPTMTHPKVAALIDEVVQTVNSQVDGWEQIEQYTLLDQPFLEARGELTTSQKLNRQVIAERYAAQIEAMYPHSLPQVEQAITQVELAPERLRQLLEKENILDAWLADAGLEFMFDLARRKQIDGPSMVHICDIAATIAQMKDELRPLSTTFIVGDPARITSILPISEIRLYDYTYIRRMQPILVTLARLVDGRLLGYVVDKYGYVRGIHKLNVALADEPANLLLGPQFRRHAAISRQCEAIIFFIPKGGRQVRVFADGHMVGRYANGNWSAESIPYIDETINRLVRERGYDEALLWRLLRCAFQMSEENLGATIIWGETEAILERADPPATQPYALLMSDDLAHLSDQALINFARQEGATLIDRQGRFRGCMVLLRPEADTKADIGPGKGARHSSAAKTSAEAGCLAIVVSRDGPITVYDRGRRVLSL
jgi:long-chain acyl-CoA synthetase